MSNKISSSLSILSSKVQFRYELHHQPRKTRVPDIASCRGTVVDAAFGDLMLFLTLPTTLLFYQLKTNLLSGPVFDELELVLGNDNSGRDGEQINADQIQQIATTNKRSN